MDIVSRFLNSMQFIISSSPKKRCSPEVMHIPFFGDAIRLPTKNIFIRFMSAPHTDVRIFASYDQEIIVRIISSIRRACRFVDKESQHKLLPFDRIRFLILKFPVPATLKKKAKHCILTISQ